MPLNYLQSLESEIVTILKGADFDQWRIVLTKFDIRKSVTNEAVFKGLEPYRREILRSRVGISEALNQAEIAGKDILRFEPTVERPDVCHGISPKFPQSLSIRGNDKRADRVICSGRILS